MKPVKWGVLGAANFARHHMAPAIHAAKGAELFALATSDPEKAKGFKDFCPGLKLHSSYDALLADPEVEAVYIPLPNHLHVEWSLKALAAGKHVLTEKPVALHAPEVDALIAARDKAGRFATEAFMIVQHPQWQKARNWLAMGEIGTLRHVDAQFSFHLTDMDNIRNRPETGGGSLYDIGVYTFGSARWVTGAEPETLQAQVRRENGVEVFAQVSGVMAGGGHRFTYASMTSMRLYNRQCVTFQGDKGMIRLEGGCFNANVNDMAEVELHRGGHAVLTERFPAANHYVLQVEAFGRHIREGAAYPWTLEDARGSLAMINAAYAAATEITI
jgi:predicted dehydrogenase